MFRRRRPTGYLHTRGQLATSFAMHSPVSSPVPRPSEFQAHIYNSFLQGRTSDVAIRISGASWDAIYNFHRIILIQAVRTLSVRSSAPFTYIPSRNSSAIFSQGGLSSRRVEIPPRGLAYPQVQYESYLTTPISPEPVRDRFSCPAHHRLTSPVPSCITAFEYVHVGFTSYPF